MRIAFAGPRGTGKTTLAQYLADHQGFTRCSLAAPIKRIISEAPTDSYERHQYLLRWGQELFPGRLVAQARFATEAARVLAAERDPGRRAQLIGTDVGRALNPEVWIRYLLAHLPDGPVAVDDVRFANECEALRQAGFVLIRLTAPPDVLAARLAARAAERRDPGHASERGLEGIPDDYWDAVWDTSEPMETTIARLEAMVGDARGAAATVGVARWGRAASTSGQFARANRRDSGGRGRIVERAAKSAGAAPAAPMPLVPITAGQRGTRAVFL